MRSISTKKGDDGFTGLLGGGRASKDALRFEALGDLDELMAAIGVARQHVRKRPTRKELLVLQESLFLVGAELATPPAKAARLRKRIDAAALADLERRLKALESRCDVCRHFVTPGAGSGSAHVDFARAVARRCERRIVALARAGQVRNKHLLAWMNRLSDYLWLLARCES